MLLNKRKLLVIRSPKHESSDSDILINLCLSSFNLQLFTKHPLKLLG